MKYIEHVRSQVVFDIIVYAVTTLHYLTKIYSIYTLEIITMLSNINISAIALAGYYIRQSESIEFAGRV